MRMVNYRQRQAGGLRYMVVALVLALATGCGAPWPGPAAPVIDTAASQVVNGYLAEPPATDYWYTSDFTLVWAHEDPLTVDYFEIWRATDEAYWTPETCTACALVGTTTALSETLTLSPPGFNPIGGTAGAEIMSGIDIYLVRAVNAGGVADSNMIGVVTFSLDQGMDVLPVE